MAEPTENKEETTPANEKTSKQKWLERLGKFLMMGGWVLVLVVALGIAIAISMLTKSC